MMNAWVEKRSYNRTKKKENESSGRTERMKQRFIDDRINPNPFETMIHTNTNLRTYLKDTIIDRIR